MLEVIVAPNGLLFIHAVEAPFDEIRHLTTGAGSVRVANYAGEPDNPRFDL